MILNITNRNIRVDNADNQISYNSDYVAEFRFDEEWNGKVKTARFVQNGEYFDVVLADDRCEIPPLKTGFVRVGVFSDSMTSTYADVYFKTSIKDGSGDPAEPPEDVYAQLTALIESGILKGDDGLTPYVGKNGNWWLGSEDTGVLARGTDGDDGYTPQKGIDYFDGEKGDKGDPFTYDDFTPEQLDALKGADGHTPIKGVDYFTDKEVHQIQNEVSSGAIGEFRQVVDSKTNEFNSNASEKLNEYNQNADNRVAEFDAQTEQIQTDISGLKSDLANKLPKSPADWEAWTAEEQKMACKRMRVEHLGEWEEIVTVTTEEAVSSIAVDTDANGNPCSLTHIICELIIPIEDTEKSRAVYFGSGSVIHPTASFSRVLVKSNATVNAEVVAYAKIISGKIYCDGAIGPVLGNYYQAAQKYGIANGYCRLSAESFDRIFAVTYSDAFPAGSQFIVRGIRK